MKPAVLAVFFWIIACLCSAPPVKDILAEPYVFMKIVFQHIPKCAGSSIHKLLTKNFKDKKIHPERFNALDKYGLDSLIHHDIFSGHFDAWRVGLVPGPKFVFTFLREPESRIISLYDFWRSHTWEMIEKLDLYGPRVAKSNSLEEFLLLSENGIPANIDNVYIRQALGRTQSKEIDSLLKTDPDLAVESAIRHYNSLNFVGFMEHINEDSKKLSRLLKIPFEDVPFENKGQGNVVMNGREPIEPTVISDSAKQLLALRSQLDRQVYQYFLERRECASA